MNPWFYRTGVFDGKFESVIGQGASGTVISGEWFDVKAAFKFVEIETRKWPKYITEGLKILDDKLSEMTSLRETNGSKIVSFYGHYRYLNFPGQIHISGNNYTSTTTLVLLFFSNLKLKKSTKPRVYFTTPKQVETTSKLRTPTINKNLPRIRN